MYPYLYYVSCYSTSDCSLRITISFWFLIFDFSSVLSLSKGEFQEGQDDMAFVTSSDIDKITIANDVITLPDHASAKSRLSVR